MDRDENGWLQPAGLQLATRQDVERLFVTNAHRIRLWQQFQEFIHQVSEQLIPVHAIWMDGSFISDKVAPMDLDMVVFTDISLLNSQFNRLDKLRNQFQQLDVYWAGSSEEKDTLSVAITGHERMKWDWVFGMNRAKQAKGYIQLID